MTDRGDEITLLAVQFDLLDAQPVQQDQATDQDQAEDQGNPDHQPTRRAGRQPGNRKDQFQPVQRRRKPAAKKQGARQFFGAGQITAPLLPAQGGQYLLIEGDSQSAHRRQCSVAEGCLDQAIEQRGLFDHRPLDMSLALTPHLAVHHEVLTPDQTELEWVHLALEDVHQRCGVGHAGEGQIGVALPGPWRGRFRGPAGFTRRGCIFNPLLEARQRATRLNHRLFGVEDPVQFEFLDPADIAHRRTLFFCLA